MSALNGRLRENVVHFRTVGEAAAALRSGQVSAVLATRAELEAALRPEDRVAVDLPKFAELKVDGWPLGMAVKAEERELAEAIAQALGELKADGTVAAIFRRHGISYQPV